MFGSRNLWTSLRRSFRDFMRGLGIALRPVKKALAAAVFGLWSWGRTRNWIHFLEALPAIAVFIAVVVLFSLRWSVSATELESRYVEKARDAFKAKNYPLAILAHERLANMEADRAETLYEMADSLARMGNIERAQRIMQKLAPDNAQGYGRAHLWMAQRLWGDLNSKDPDVRQHARRQIEKHLERVQVSTSGVSEDDIATLMLGKLALQFGELDKAELYIAKAADKSPIFLLDYARVLKMRKRDDDAKVQGQMAAKFYDSRVKRDNYDRNSRVQLAEAQAFLEDFRGAIKTLEQGFAFTKDQEYKFAIANAYLAWQQSEGKKNPDAIAPQLELLQAGLRWAPNHPQLINALMQFVWNDDAKIAKDARDKLNKVLGDGHKAAPAAHFLFGMDHWKSGEKDKALVHWEMAYAEDPNLLAVANNLAWGLAHRQNPDMDRALKIADLAVMQAPQDPQIRDTRGRIYMKTKNWKAALKDLEFINNTYPDYPMIHAALAEVYDNLEMTDIADVHRALQERAVPSKGGKKTDRK